MDTIRRCCIHEGASWIQTGDDKFFLPVIGSMKVHHGYNRRLNGTVLFRSRAMLGIKNKESKYIYLFNKEEKRFFFFFAGY
ncbi:MAG: hypothetical protein KJ077_27395 [Anaerolineae bacterium]|nr:hypothetical protein [Anaerolineae bacterium]